MIHGLRRASPVGETQPGPGNHISSGRAEWPAIVARFGHSISSAAFPGGASAVQRRIDIQDANDGMEAEDYTSYVNAVFDLPEYAADARLRDAEAIHLDIRVEQASESPAQHASTIVSEVLPEQPEEANWSDVLRGANQLTIRIRIFPSFEDGKGDIMAHLMHELTLHVSPKLEHLRSLRRGEGSAQTHLTHVVQGEDEQHSDPAAWRLYLANAVAAGNRLKSQGQIEEGSDLVMSAVNDTMTHTVADAGSPMMSQLDRQAVYAEADQIGTQEATYQRQHPDIWPTSESEDD
jgi:hypothetical protein